MARVDAAIDAISPILAGEDPGTQGTILAGLVAMWIAGFQGKRDMPTSDLRAALLREHRNVVQELIRLYDQLREQRDRQTALH